MSTVKYLFQEKYLWSFPDSSVSDIVCGKGAFSVSGRNDAAIPAMMQLVPIDTKGIALPYAAWNNNKKKLFKSIIYIIQWQQVI